MNTSHTPAGHAAAEDSTHTGGQRRKKLAKKRYMILAAVIFLCLGGYFLVSWLTYYQESTDDAQTSADMVGLAARVGGPVVNVAVQDNQFVHKGDLIVQIDPKDYEIAIRQAQAEYEAALAQAEEEGAHKGAMTKSSSLAQIDSAKAFLSRAVAEKRKAEADLARARKLQGQHAVSVVELETAQNVYDKAVATANQAAAQLEMAQEQHTMAHAKVASAAAALEYRRAQLSYTTILAPNDGTLSRIAVKEGDLVEPGRLIAQLITGQPYVIANFKEIQVGRMKAGQHAEIEVDAYPGRYIEGRVLSLSPATGAQFSLLPPDNATGNFVKVVQRVPVKIELLNIPKDITLKAGLSVDAKVYFK